jgi:hypothetical protein
MKKILSMVLVLVLSCMVVTAAFASHTSSISIKAEGYIGFDKDTDIADYVNAELKYPAEVKWYVNDATLNSTTGKYDVKSVTYEISHNASRMTNGVTQVAEFEVTLQKFDVITNDGLNAALLTLNLTGDLREGAIGANLQNGYEAAAPYSTLLNYGDVWSFSFDGEYSGSLPAEAIRPEYRMELCFKLDNIRIIENP